MPLTKLSKISILVNKTASLFTKTQKIALLVNKTASLLTKPPIFAILVNMCYTRIMKKIITRSYLQKLIQVIDTPDIKVITGVRRSGKSVLLKSFKDYIIENIKRANIIHIDFNLIKFAELRDYLKLNTYIEEHHQPGKHNFVLIDEVQMCPNFETTINSLHASEKYDIYITGSNAFLLSSDLATLFTGRTHTIEIFPFSLKEYQDYFEEPDIDKAFDGYFNYGGFAGSYPYQTQADRHQYVADVYNTLIIRDIQQKYNIQYPPLLNRIGDFLMNNISNLTTGRSITNALNSDGQNISHNTIEAYLKYLCEAYAFYKIKRYDISGKAYLYSQDKYYLCDHIMKYAKLGTKNLDYGRAYENIVCLELLRRGYEVYIGTLRDKEIDFVAKRPNEQLYIQVSYDIGEESTFTREVAPLLDIRDAYPCLLIARTKQPEYTHEGIHIIDIARWLTSE